MMRNAPKPLMLCHLYIYRLRSVCRNPVYMATLKLRLSSRIFIWFGWRISWCTKLLSGIRNDFSGVQIPREFKPFYGLIERWEIKWWYWWNGFEAFKSDCNGINESKLARNGSNAKRNCDLNFPSF